MNTRLMRACAAIVWSSAAIGGSAPASATAVTLQEGLYASCSASYQPYSDCFCYDGSSGQWVCALPTSYTQNIKLVTPGCSAGECNSDTSNVYTDQVYGTGRKEANLVSLGCTMSAPWWYAYTLGSCAC
jgi:hypothetical protein